MFLSIKGGFKDGLQNFMKEKNLKVVLMGTRKNDPHTDDLEIISTTDHNYPPFLRVNPILYWSYEQVWNFIRSFKVPYCKLYNEGYTYLGNRNTTVKNPYLQKDDN